MLGWQVWMLMSSHDSQRRYSTNSKSTDFLHMAPLLSVWSGRTISRVERVVLQILKCQIPLEDTRLWSKRCRNGRLGYCNSYWKCGVSCWNLPTKGAATTYAGHVCACACAHIDAHVCTHSKRCVTSQNKLQHSILLLARDALVPFSVVITCFAIPKSILSLCFSLRWD